MSSLPAQESLKQNQAFPAQLILLFGLACLWLQLFLSCSQLWIDSEYYGYGWFAPPAIALFIYNRIHGKHFPLRCSETIALWSLIITVLAVILIVFPLRTFWYFDASWRVPLWAHTVFTVVITHGLIALWLGLKRSIYFIPITIFALSAVPYPYQIENLMIRKMTGLVIQASIELFSWMGRPVEMVGERLVWNEQTVEVSDGCSGIRSFQSLLFASLFFGELFLLNLWKRITLIVTGLVIALLVNAGRAVRLAMIRFDEGQEAFDTAHDSVGHIAFIIAATLLFITAKLLQSYFNGSRKLVTKTTTSSNPQS